MIDEVEENSRRGNRELEGVEYFQKMKLFVCKYIHIYIYILTFVHFVCHVLFTSL